MNKQQGQISSTQTLIIVFQLIDINQSITNHPNPTPPKMSTLTQPTPAIQKYYIRLINEQIIVNGQPVNYGKQILDLDKLYIIETQPNTQLKTPIILNKTKHIDELDRAIFMKRFLLEMVKALEICSIEDAVFIIKRVPENLKYLVGILQKVTLVRWNQLLNSDSFFLAFYETIDLLISKREISRLRSDYVENLLQTRLKTVYSRLYFMLDSLVLEDQNLRNSLLNLTRIIVLREIEEKYFFQKCILGNINTPIKDQDDDENSSIDDNKSDSGSIPEDKDISFPQKFLQNSISVIKSCQKLKIAKETITTKVLNQRFFKILKDFFQTFFERQRLELLEILALASQIEPLQMWKVTFEQGRTIRCKSLLYLESLLTNSMINYSQTLKKPKRGKKSTLIPSKKEPIKEEIGLPDSYKSWQLTAIIVQKFITFQSPQRKVFLNKILNSLLNCKLIHEELECILIFLQSSSKDDVYLKKNMEIWRLIVLKIEGMLNQIRKPRAKRQNQKRNTRTSHQSITSSQEQTQTSIPAPQRPLPSSHLIMPISKPSLITLMKIYKLLLTNEKRFNIRLNEGCLMYLLEVTERRKGLIEGVRLTLIEVIGKGDNNGGDVVDVEGFGGDGGDNGRD